MTNVRHPIKFHWNSSTEFDMDKEVITSVLCSPSEIFFIQFSCVGGFEPCFSGPHKTPQNAKSLNVFLLGNIFWPTLLSNYSRTEKEKKSTKVPHFDFQQGFGFSRLSFFHRKNLNEIFSIAIFLSRRLFVF